MERAYQTIWQSGIQEGTLYVQITRGVAPRSHPFPAPSRFAHRGDHRPAL